MLRHKAGREELPFRLRAENAVLSTVGFYTNKKKYHRQVGLRAAGGAALGGRVAVACAGVTRTGSGSCRPQLPGGLAPALSIL